MASRRKEVARSRECSRLWPLSRVRRKAPPLKATRRGHSTHKPMQNGPLPLRATILLNLRPILHRQTGILRHGAVIGIDWGPRVWFGGGGRSERASKWIMRRNLAAKPKRPSRLSLSAWEFNF